MERSIVGRCWVCPWGGCSRSGTLMARDGRCKSPAFWLRQQAGIKVRMSHTQQAFNFLSSSTLSSQWMWPSSRDVRLDLSLFVKKVMTCPGFLMLLQ
jgi:hypothetical protein